MAASVLYPERDRQIKKDRFGDTERGETDRDRDAEAQRHRERQRNRESQTDKQ